ncbi:MAG: helix-turn-helix domain-containing protein [Terriglobales bacterium]
MRERLEALVAEMVDKGIHLDEARTEFERRFIKRVLERQQGKLCQAAEALGMHRNSLARKLSELELAPKAALGRRARAGR